jgi:translation elongation factor EF-G
VVGLAGLENYIFKSGTISTSEECLSFVPISSKTKSILKVSVSTPDIKNGPKLLEGLKKLNRSDPSVDVYVEGTGDIILNTCGQVHLEKCVTDLENIYCKVPIKTSEPIITFRETITWFTLKETKNQKYLQDL